LRRRSDEVRCSYEFRLPKDVSVDAQQRFTDAYSHACIDAAGHGVTAGNMWYYYRPEAGGCSINDSDVVKLTASAVRSVQNSTNKYPEYHKVWEDNALEVISIFGKYEASGGVGDAGVSAFNEFVQMMKSELGETARMTPEIADSPGPDTKDVTFETTLADGKKVKVTALLVDSIMSTWDGFDARYESLTPTADLIVYNGHAGLGTNVRALARKGQWNKGKYQVFFMNGCDTFSYVDGSLAQTRSAINPDDPTGTKYMEFVTNAMPSYFASMASATTTVVKGLLSYSEPMTYKEIFKGIDHHEVVLVTGEEDNVFHPGMPLNEPAVTSP
jgi:hypothetical protein